MNQVQCNDFMESILDIGRLMIQFGAEVWRVEDAITRICEAYNIKKTEVYTSTTLIVATIRTYEGITSTQSVRVGRSSNNLGALEALNELSRYICFNKPDIDNIATMTNDAISSVKISYYNCLGYVLAAGGFAVFFGGSWIDGIVAGALGVLVFFMDKFLKIEDDNKLIYIMIMSFITGVSAILLVKIGIGQNVDKIIIGVVMLFIPALALVNGLKDMFYRNIISGVFRIIESILVAISIALGFGLSIATIGGIL